MTFTKMHWVEKDGKRKLEPTGEPDVHFECDNVLMAVGQENSFPWIERDIGMTFDKWDMPDVDEVTFQSSIPNVFFGGDAAFGRRTSSGRLPMATTPPCRSIFFATAGV